MSSGLALAACSAEPAAPVTEQPIPTSAPQADSPSVAEPPPALAFQLSLDGVDYELSLERAPLSTTADYQSYRVGHDGALVASSGATAVCSYRGRAEPTVAHGAALAEAEQGFASVSVCPSATGQPVGQALSGIIRAGDRFWQVWPEPADTDPSDGVDHWLLPVQRKDTPGMAPASPRLSTIVRAPTSPAPQLKYREGTPEETKYIELVLINDAARVAELGGQTEARGIQFVETMNALLEGSGLVPRLRVTLRAQVQLDADPYVPTFAGDEVDHESLMDEFLAWATTQDLPPHDEHVLLSGLDFLGAVVGYAGLDAACNARQNGFIVEAGSSGGGFAALSAVHELGHTVGMSHDNGAPGCSQTAFIMAAVGCANCARDNQFSSCSLEQFADYLAGPAYAEGGLCADDVPSSGGVASCGDGVVQGTEACDCGAEDCGDIDPCCDGAACQLRDGAECSDYNDGCCQGCAIVGADAALVCRQQRSECDIEEVCTGASKACPADTFEAAGSACEDDRGNAGSCYFGDCRSRGTQCEQIAEQQGEAFANIGAPGPNCNPECDRVVCGGQNGCVIITGPTVANGVPCEGGGQCVDQACVTLVDQCPGDPAKSEPGACGCGTSDTDEDSDGAPDCTDACPEDPEKQAPGACGCGTSEADTDADGAPDCTDACPEDRSKREPGACGCGSADTDSDGDGTPDCTDNCPDDPTSAGPTATDIDRDGTPDCQDGCPEDGTRDTPPCGASTTNTADDNEGNAAAVRASASGSCAVARGSERGHLGWLLLGAVPFVRRRRRRVAER